MQKSIKIRAPRQRPHKRALYRVALPAQIYNCLFALKYVVMALCAVLHYLNRDNVKSGTRQAIYKVLTVLTRIWAFLYFIYNLCHAAKLQFLFD